MMNNLEYVKTLTSSSDVVLTQANQTATNYKLENLQLEYEATTNDQLAEEISSMFSLGRSIPYEYVTMFQKTSWEKDSCTKS